jgi:hypothetical protein
MSDLTFLFDRLEASEREGRLRELRVLVAVYCGWDSPAKTALDQVLIGEVDLNIALAEIDKMPTLRRRRLLSSFGALAMESPLG